VKSMTVDLILHNGHIVTADRDFSVRSSAAIAHGRFVAISDTSLAYLARPGTKIVDLRGRFVMPGLVDAYSHVMTSGLDLLPSGGKVNITTLYSIADILAAIHVRAGETPNGEWIATSCMYRGGLAEGRWPNRWDLDQVAPDHPVYIMQGGRPIIANTLALRLAGVDRDTADPTDPAGKIVRDKDGAVTGQLIGGAADLARRRWSARFGIPPEEWDFLLCGPQELIAALEAQQKVMHACGVTATRDVATMRREVSAYVTARDEGKLRLRTQLLVIVPERYMRTDADFAQVYDSFFHPWETRDELLGIGGVAIDYSLDGWRMMDRDSLFRHIREGNRRGWTVSVTPGIGSEQEVDDYLDALEAADKERPIAGRRFPVMHPMGLRRADQRQRARKLGLVLNPNPLLNHFAAERSVKMFEAVRTTGLLQSKATTGLEQAAAIWGMSQRDWFEDGLIVSAGSNTPAAVYDPERPFIGLYTLATGITRVGSLVKDQSISRRQAVEAFTRNGAYAMKQQNQFGSIAPGMIADFILVDTNLLDCDDTAIAEAKVLETYFGGKQVYAR
jgi:predicted amidohydrolase YtcJ